MSADLVIVTAASSNHFGALRLMLESLRDLDARVECYDIGLTPDEARALPRWPRCVHHTFDYAVHPPHMHVSVNAGEYAWKPVIVAEVVERSRASGQPYDILWTDAGCYFHALEPIAARIAASGGLWVRTSAGTMREWTHPLMFEYLKADPSVFAEKPNADATLVGFATGSGTLETREAVYQRVIEPWRACAMAKDCIAPPGSSRKNHRQDQAVLSYLVHAGGYRFATDTRDDIAIRCKCDRWFYNYIGYGVPKRVYAGTCLA